MHGYVEMCIRDRYADGWYLCFREKTEQEMRYAELTGKLEYMAMMTGVDMEAVSYTHLRR